MATEIERKFLITNDSWKSKIVRSSQYRQGYMSSNKNSSIRIRISDNKAHLNIKSATLGISRDEYDYEIPLGDASEMLDKLCGKPLIEKTRYVVQETDGNEWEIDVFSGDNEGLIVAEIELEHPKQGFLMPAWVGKEVSDDPRYYNVCLVDQPFKNWSSAELETG